MKSYLPPEDARRERIKELQEEELKNLMKSSDSIEEVLERIYELPTHIREFNQLVFNLLKTKDKDSADALIHFIESCAHAQAFHRAMAAYDMEIEEAREAEAENYHFHRRQDAA